MTTVKVEQKEYYQILLELNSIAIGKGIFLQNFDNLRLCNVNRGEQIDGLKKRFLKMQVKLIA